MKKIGVFICNFNKKEYILNNLESLHRQTFLEHMDIYVVDNASTDGSPDAIEEKYPAVTVIRNEENLGGAGGFYIAQTEGEKLGYEYLLMADNDIVAEEDAVEKLFSFLQQHEDVGMVGAQLFFMDQPNKIWVYGNTLDFEKYRIIDGFGGQDVSDDMPEVVYCDTVPSCFSLIRAKCLEKTGYMPRENFISWDDIEWCYRFGLAGYKVAAISAARVWHKTGGKVLTNHFGTYYYNRNKIRFFAKYLPENKTEEYAKWLVKDIFTRTYGLAQKGYVNNVKALMYAFADFVYDVRGKAADYKITPYDESKNPLEGYKGEVIKCNHVRDITQYEDGKVYEDVWHNTIMSYQDFYYFQNFENAYRNFEMIYLDAVVQRIKTIREKEC